MRQFVRTPPDFEFISLDSVSVKAQPEKR